MAYAEGTADGFRGLFCEIIDHLTEVNALGSQWEILRGNRDATVEYYDTSIYPQTNTYLAADVSFAMGADDFEFGTTFASDFPYWLDLLTNETHAIGMEKDVAVLPYKYELRAVNLNDSTKLGYMAATWQLESSDDDITWSVVSTGSHGAWTADESVEVLIDQLTTPAKFWRINFITNNGNSAYIGIGRLRFYSDATTPMSQAYSQEFILRGEGAAEESYSYNMFRFHYDRNYGWYTIEMGSAFGYDANASFTAQPSFKSGYMPSWEDPIPYRISYKKFRFYINYTISTTCHFGGLGFYLPYTTPSQMPYPYFIFTETSTLTHDWTEPRLSIGTHAYTGSYIFTLSKSWLQLNAFNYLGFPDDGYTCGISPNLFMQFQSQDGSLGKPVKRLLDDSYPVVDLEIVSKNSLSPGVKGTFDGIKWVTGDQNAYENTFTLEGVEYVVLQNIFRTDNRSYTCMEKS